jgi:hypothetical protein
MVELLKKHPKTLELIKEHFTEIFFNSLEKEDIPEGFRELAKAAFTEEKIVIMIDNQPRALFDFFDKHSLHGYVFWNDGWGYGMNHTSIKTASFPTRRDAELICVEELLQIMEGRLNNNDNVGVSESNSSSSGE